MSAGDSADVDAAILAALDFTPTPLTCSIVMHQHLPVTASSSSVVTARCPTVAGWRLRTKCWQCNGPLPVELICGPHRVLIIRDQRPLTEACPLCGHVGAVLVMSIVPITQPSEETRP